MSPDTHLGCHSDFISIIGCFYIPQWYIIHSALHIMIYRMILDFIRKILSTAILAGNVDAFIWMEGIQSNKVRWDDLCLSCIANLDNSLLMFPVSSVCSVVGKHSPSPCLYHYEMLFECSRGHDPFSRDVLGLHWCVSISAPSPLHAAPFLCTLDPHSHTHSHPERIHTHTNTHTNQFVRLNESDWFTPFKGVWQHSRGAFRLPLRKLEMLAMA